MDKLFSIKNSLRGFSLCVALAIGQAFGQSLEDVGVALHGGNPLNPTADSLLGRYIRETGAATVIRRFGNGHGDRGVHKLAVALSRESLSTFISVLSSPHFFYHLHTPRAGTFQFVHQGRSGSYARLGGPLGALPPGTLLTPVLLDRFETDRFFSFLRLATFNSSQAQAPWSLVDDNGQRYSATSAWTGCTNWVGQMPLGRTLVSEYLFPSGDNGASPNRQTLIPYSTSGYSSEHAQVLREVWSVPGHQQFGMMLYPQGHLEGEFTNTGWVAHALLGSVGNDRTPIMFVFVADHTEALPSDFPMQTRPY